jgi:hypothetical protein
VWSYRGIPQTGVDISVLPSIADVQERQSARLVGPGLVRCFALRSFFGLWGGGDARGSALAVTPPGSSSDALSLCMCGVCRQRFEVARMSGANPEETEGQEVRN